MLHVHYVFFIRFTIRKYWTLSIYLNAVSSNSHLIVLIPKRCASGAYISKVSFEILTCFSLGIAFNVLILCRRSANFTKITRTSLAMAINSFLWFSACCSSLERYLTFKFCYTIYNTSNLFIEHIFNIFKCIRRVFYDIM